MTNEKAIKLLHRLQDEQFDGIHGDERREALNMAVMALSSQQTDTDSQGLVNDCISRKMAIEALDGFRCGTKAAWKVIEDLPSAQPTQTNADSTQTNVLDCISRQAAIVVFENSGLDDDSKDTAVRVLEQLPSAQPERKKGKWIWWYEETFTEYATEYTPHCKCSECGRECAPRVATSSNFCRNCGADMRGESE